VTRGWARFLTATIIVSIGSVVSAQESRPSVGLPGFRGLVRLDTVGIAVDYDAPFGRVMSVLQEAFVDIGVQPDVDSAKGHVGKFDIKTQRRFAQMQLSALLDCGARNKGPNADFYRVHMALLGLVKPGANGKTNVRIAVAAGAQDFAGPLADPIACSSTGRLEERMRAFIEGKLKG
jgi:hypothetical protein